ncbi:17613_t:CDS:2, partial [Funneliformis caledonium]
ESHPKSTTKNVESESGSSLAKITQKTSRKRKNESESENSSAPKRRSERIASQDSDLASVIHDLRLRSTFSSYGVEDLPSSAYKLYKFKIRDMEALKVNFLGASTENAVIPDIEATIPEKYVLPDIDSELLGNPKFNVVKIDGLTDEEVQTFVDKLHDVVLNGVQVVGTDETFTDTLVDDLLRITKLNNWPLKIRNHPLCKLYIEDEPCVSSDSEFVIKMRNLAILVYKHLKNVGYGTNFGESQIAVEILACGSENIRSLGASPTDQTLWAVRVITTYVTFYKTTIPVKYWGELAKGLPQEEVKVQRWPAENGLITGFDLATPRGRRSVLTGLAKIREFLKQQPP